MVATFAILTSDPNLLRCELWRLRGEVVLTGPDRFSAVGLGYCAQDGVLLRRCRADAAPASAAELWPGVEAEALLYHAALLPLGTSLEENTQPFRWGRWLFAHGGKVHDFARSRGRVMAALPEYLQRQVRGETAGEAAFALFLKHLRETGRADDRNLDAALAAQLLGKAARLFEQLTSEPGAARTSTLNFVATNGRVLVATRYGDEPLLYALLEGSSRCELCQLDPRSPEMQPKLRAHRRCRTVALASWAAGSSGWMDVPNGHALAVDARLNVQRLPI